MKDLLNIPDWAKRKGVIGLIAFAVLMVLFFTFDTIAQSEIERFWLEFSPSLAQWLKQGIVIPNWLFWIVILCILIVGYFTYHLFSKRWNPWLFLPLPKKRRRLGFTKIDIAIALSRLNAQEMSSKDFAEIVQQAVNHDKIKPSLAAKYLAQIGFDLILKPDGLWVAEVKK